MTLVLELPVKTEIRLRDAAARQGRDVSDYIIDAALLMAATDSAKTKQSTEAEKAFGEMVNLNQRQGLYEE